MAAYSPDEFSARVAGGVIPPVVLVTGEEQLLADECVERLVDAALDAASRQFNLDVVDAAKMPVPEIVARASSYPMMGDRRVLIVRNADRLGANEAGREQFTAYLGHASATTCLILTAEKVDARRKPFTDLRKHFDVVECKGLHERLIPGWIQTRAMKLGKRVDGEAAALLHAYTGESLLALLREVEKLVTYVGERPDITKNDVAAAVGATKGATIFDLQDAVGRKDVKAATGIVRRMMLAGEQPPLIIANLTRHLSLLLSVAESVGRRMNQSEIAAKLAIHPYRVKLMSEVVSAFSTRELIDGLHALRESDRRIKTSQTDPRTEMDLVILRIIRGERLHERATG